ncbi:hypothetical protein Y032_0014g2488 [Ancylostoma ceylanicum]|uniref:Uncharacterized protein n=1 Tax=Ancylostoma ceylanicum TaxID=53326 RepID=A0A016VBH6_9BILA|nr:hypothetical protein Y032_0014g2488 [Ancylostoma ceylanicum]
MPIKGNDGKRCRLCERSSLKHKQPQIHGYAVKLTDLRYTGVHDEGYIDPVTGKFVFVPEMHSELVVPNLEGFKLKPYVSFRTDVEIEKRRRTYEAKVKEKGSKALADLYTLEDERWPPPKMDAETLFELSYGEQIRQAFKEGKYGAVEKKKIEES